MSLQQLQDERELVELLLTELSGVHPVLLQDPRHPLEEAVCHRIAELALALHRKKQKTKHTHTNNKNLMIRWMHVLC